MIIIVPQMFANRNLPVADNNFKFTTKPVNKIEVANKIRNQIIEKTSAKLEIKTLCEGIDWENV